LYAISITSEEKRRPSRNVRVKGRTAFSSGGVRRTHA
jgi:hypothetical protein